MDEEQPAIRCSSRQRKPTKMHYVEEEEEDVDEIDPEDFEEDDNNDDDASNTTQQEQPQRRRPGIKPGQIRKFFKPAERLQIFQFILSECRSKAPGREGRVAKMRVQTRSSRVWEKLKLSINGDRESCIYRNHYECYAKKLHMVRGLTLEEKADLYYAMDIPVVDELERDQLIEKYGIIINEGNIVTGSTHIQHWDAIHSESEDDAEDDEITIRETSRFLEYHDGLMWQFILNRINSEKDPIVHGINVWKDFREKHNAYIVTKKAAAAYNDRYRRVLVPNLHNMPFDIETKAALYQSLDYQVPEEFRETLIAETGVTLSDTGFVEDYINRPAHLVLQSKSFDESPIGLTLTTKFSSLREPQNFNEPRPLCILEDNVPYTHEEDMEIFEYVRRKATNSAADGRLMRFGHTQYAHAHFWYNYSSEVQTERKCFSLAQRFKRLRNLIMDTDYDLRTKMELYFICCKPVEKEALEQFKTIAVLVLYNKDNNVNKGTIRFALGRDFIIGRVTDEKLRPNMYQYVFENSLFKQILRATTPYLDKPTMDALIMTYIDRFETEQQSTFESLSNSVKFPYIDAKPGRSRVRQNKKNAGARKRKSPNKSESPEIQPPEKELKLEPLDPEENPSIPSTSSAAASSSFFKYTRFTEKDIKFMFGDERVEEDGAPSTSEPTTSTDFATESRMKMEEALKTIEQQIQTFTRNLQMSSRNLENSKRISYITELDQLTRMFRSNAKEALIEKKKATKKPLE